MTESLSERYAPTVAEYERKVDGEIIRFRTEDYGQAHIRRQADAMAALEGGRTPVVLSVECKDRVVARVHHTGRDDEMDLIIAIAPPGTAITPDLHRLNQASHRVGDERITYTKATVADPLRAGVDRDLEHPCQCGKIHELDRRKILERIAFGQRVTTVNEIAPFD